jgi:hypothetical protein
MFQQNTSSIVDSPDRPDRPHPPLTLAPSPIEAYSDQEKAALRMKYDKLSARARKKSKEAARVGNKT